MKMKLYLKMWAILAVCLATITVALATDQFTWKPTDLFVKRNLYVAGHIYQGVPSDGAANAYNIAPQIAAGTGAGTSPTVSIVGSDVAGLITVTTGSLPATSAVIATVTFGSAYKTNSFPDLVPANAATQALVASAQAYPVGSTANFTLNTGSTGLAATTTYKWYYQVSGN
ncbi:MAG: hypothetical protein KGI50_07680 [Patescibacteria group bacterium]|nr:hypothetical protein [Patescibacteria group bacterium]